MFYSTYIPTNIGRSDCAVYSDTKVFDQAHLVRAYNFLTHTGEQSVGVECVKSCVTFMDDPTISWTIHEVYFAYKALKTAVDNNFGFFIVKDLDGIPQLFVSKNFRNHRILVNALTTRSVVLTNPIRITCVTSLIDKKVPYTFCQEVYRNLEAIEDGATNILSLLIVHSGSIDEYVVTNPYTLPYGAYIRTYGADLVEEMRQLTLGVTETESLKFTELGIERIDGITWPLIAPVFAQDLVKRYDDAKARKSNYIPIYDEDLEDALYFSTNSRYLVRAKTLEFATVTNKQIKKLLNVMANKDSNTHSEIEMAWRLASMVK